MWNQDLRVYGVMHIRILIIRLSKVFGTRYLITVDIYYWVNLPLVDKNQFQYKDIRCIAYFFNKVKPLLSLIAVRGKGKERDYSLRIFNIYVMFGLSSIVCQCICLWCIFFRGRRHSPHLHPGGVGFLENPQEKRKKGARLSYVYCNSTNVSLSLSLMFYV